MVETTTDDIVRALAATPARLRDVVARAGDSLDARPRDGAWSILDVIRHVRVSDAIVANRAYYILVRDDPPLPAFDDRRWAALLAGVDLPLRARLTEFGVRRAELAGVLRALTPDQWERAGQHEVRGRLTLRQICTGIVEHEAEHLAQLHEIVAALRVDGGRTGA